MEENEFRQVVQFVKEKATQLKHVSVLNWLKNKEGDNSWMLKFISRATSKMNWDDWYSTSRDTNIAESAHAHSHRDGINLTLVAAVETGKKLDERSLHNERAAQTMGIISKYGNQSVTVRTAKSIKRAKKSALKKAKNNPAARQQEDILERAQELVHDGVSVDAVELFLKTEKQKQNVE
jgi:hypothetical protein